MKQKVRNSGNGTNKVLGRVGAEKKKAVIALCLIAVMALMWARMLGRKTPKAAEAALIGQGAKSTGELNSESKVSFIELPKVKGRNDVLTRDFFASNGWQDFIGDKVGTEEVSTVSKDGSEEVARRVAEKMKLEAIGLGKNPQAFINNKVLSVGDKLLISEGVDTYECEVAGIEENTVLVRCGEAKIVLKLTQPIEAQLIK